MKLKLNWGNSLIIFFLIFFIWVFSFVFFAMRQNNDLVADDYYQLGAKYSDQISINQRSVAYRDSIEISTAGNNIQLFICKSLVTTGDSIKVYFFRSSDKAKDLRFSFSKPNSPLLIGKTGLLHGRYQVFISWNDKGEKFMVNKTVDIE
jgi:hypothetical protein